MKKTTLIFTFLLLPFLAMAQKEISLAVNNVHTGNNISLKYGLYLSPKTQFEFGVKYHINSNIPKSERESGYTDVFARNQLQHWGLDGSLYRDISPERFKTRIRLLYNMQYTYASYRTYMDPAFLSHLVENNFGVNFKAPITEKLFINISGGVGILASRGNETVSGIQPGIWEASFSRFLSFGIVYRIK